MIDVPPEPLPSQVQAIEQRLIKCGLRGSGFTVKYEDYLQSIEIVIAPEAGASADDFECIKKAAGYEIVTFTDTEMYRAFSDYEGELTRPYVLAESKAALESKGLLEGFPSRSEFANLDDYSIALEAHLGFEPRTALRADGSAIVLQPAPDGRAAFSERQLNLMSAIAFAGARDDVQFYIVGNESFRVEPYRGR